MHDAATTRQPHGPAAPEEWRRRVILAAAIRVVGTKGYGPTSVADVIEEARVSPAHFREHFKGRRDCFLAAYEMLVEQVFDEFSRICNSELPWLARVTDGLAKVIDLFAADPALARTAMVEVAAAGGTANRLYGDAIARIADQVHAGHPSEADQLPEEISLLAIGSVAGLIAKELRAGRAGELPDRLPELLFAMLVPYLGPAAAAGEMRRAALTAGRRRDAACREPGATSP